jgi:anti-sigma regulatory factor (Ser/Thr protein kinase)
MPGTGDTPIALSKLVVPSKPEYMPSVREFIEKAALNVGFTEQETQRIVTAAFEAVANAATHGSPHGPQDVITIKISIYDDRFVVEIIDHGNGIALAPKAMPDVTSLRGRGIPLMKALVDDVEIVNNSGARVILTKYRRQPSDHELT